MKFCAVTDKGVKRTDNQDCVFATDQQTGLLPNLFLVADGMGGHKAGDEASNLAIMSMLSYLRGSTEKDIGKSLKNAIDIANREVYKASLSCEEKRGMGTTIVALTIGESITMASVGDSRIYVSGNSGFRQITKDHTLVGEMLRMGTITKDLAKRHPKRHMITRAVGVEDTVKADYYDVPTQDAKQLLLCTDGLYEMLSEEEIEAIINTNEDVSVRANRLVQVANEKGGVDNITALLIDNR